VLHNIKKAAPKKQGTMHQKISKGGPRTDCSRPQGGENTNLKKPTTPNPERRETRKENRKTTREGPIESTFKTGWEGKKKLKP